MPGGDGTGPWGQGSMTGRGLGYCAGYDTPGFTKGPEREMGRGRGHVSGYGRGIAWRRGWGGRGCWGGYGGPITTPYALAPIINPLAPGAVQNMTPENQLAMLKQEKEYLNSELNGIKNAIDDISKKIQELENKE